ncbi:MAG TPA: magnesium-translocating P-type ATPase [Pirellulales bacterium]|nr:magnesium-translocating P-type ATPase [Pirellulales bacterium]
MSPLLTELAATATPDVLQKLVSSPDGLSEEEAERRLEQYGYNIVAEAEHHSRLKLLIRAILNPLVILLAALAIISVLTDDLGSAVVMLVMIVLGVGLRFWQESKADSAAAALKAMISVTATVVRDGAAREVPLAQVAPGDVVKLAAGDMIPADLRLLSCKDLFLIQASLTGESFPVEKFDAAEPVDSCPALELKNTCFLGTSVESGTALAVVSATGSNTYLGGMAKAIVSQDVQTSFDKGVSKFTWLMIKFILVMAPTVFIINAATKLDWSAGLFRGENLTTLKEAFFFSVAVAVGMTPEMLPMIVTVCLSKGALAMSRKKVIVKRLNSIQNFGAMDVLCTDKTGTLTLDRVILQHHCDVVREEDDNVLILAYLNSHFQTGLKNVLDRAVLQHEKVQSISALQDYKKIDEIPFDFQRRLMSVVVETPEAKHRLVCKGAPEELFKRCMTFELEGKLYPIEQILIEDLREEYERLSSDGFRVLGIAYRDFDRSKTVFSKDDESNLVLRGYIAFLDPPKETASPAIVALRQHGVDVKVLTGDNDLVSRKICSEVGIPTESTLLGVQVEKMNDAELAEAAGKTTLFARLSPAHKQRIIKALQSKGHVVGFMGDGINDAPALRAADVGISVDTAVDIAKESADVILLEKSLLVLEEGILEGRNVFANILKYIRMGASSSFGNMFSVLGASAFLPFEPMAPIQILTNNLLYDFSQVPIPTDDVDPELVAKPHPWSMKDITRFILLIGPCSSIFDYVTFFVMMYVFKAWLPHTDATAHGTRLFQTGWFIESLLTQTLIIHVIRTNKIPFIQSRASWPVIVTTAVIMGIGVWLPFSPIAGFLGFVPVPGLYWPIVIAILFCYIVLTQLVKTWLVRRRWI